MAKRDYYEILGLPRTASSDELKKAYRKLAMKFHPDKNPGDKKSEDRFKEITEAYDTLSDDKKRAQYDQFGHFAAQGGFQGGAGGPFDGFSQRYGGFGGAKGFEGFQPGQEGFQDVFSDIFGDLFAGGRARSGRSTRERGSDLRYSLTVTFEEAALGCDKPISFVRQRAGKEETARLSVTVPAGVRGGQRLKLRGEGDGAPSSGPTGDLYVIVNVQEHPLFKRVDNDVHMDLPLTFVDAALGTSVEFPTLTGKASLRVPPGTHSGQSFRLKGKGFSSVGGGAAGDMLVRVMVDVPKELNEEQRQLLQKLAPSLRASPLIKAYLEKLDAMQRGKK